MLSVTKKKIYLDYLDLFFYIAYIIYFIALFMENAMIINNLEGLVKFLKLLAIVAVGCFVFSLIKCKKYKIFIKTSKIAFLNLIVFITFALLIKDIKVFTFGLFVFGAQYVDTRKIPDVSFGTLLFLVTMVIVMYLCGVFPNLEPGPGGASWSLRLSMGFCHYNKLPIAVLFFSFFYFNMKKEISYGRLMLFLVLNIVVSILCGSKNAFLCTIVFLGLLFLIKIKNGRLKELLFIVARWGMAICIAFSIISLFLFMRDTEIGYVLNEIFNNRIRMVENYLVQVDRIYFINTMSYEEYMALGWVQRVDNSYFYIMIRYGILGVIELLLLYNAIFRKILLSKDYILALAMLVFSIAIMIDGIVLIYGAFALYIYGIGNQMEMDAHGEK